MMGQDLVKMHPSVQDRKHPPGSTKPWIWSSEGARIEGEEADDVWPIQWLSHPYLVGTVTTGCVFGPNAHNIRSDIYRVPTGLDFHFDDPAIVHVPGYFRLSHVQAMLARYKEQDDAKEWDEYRHCRHDQPDSVMSIDFGRSAMILESLRVVGISGLCRPRDKLSSSLFDSKYRVVVTTAGTEGKEGKEGASTSTSSTTASTTKDMKQSIKKKDDKDDKEDQGQGPEFTSILCLENAEDKAEIVFPSLAYRKVLKPGAIFLIRNIKPSTKKRDPETVFEIPSVAGHRAIWLRFDSS